MPKENEPAKTTPFEDVHVFRAGDYGPKGKFTKQDVVNIAASYDPKFLEAPVTIDHEQWGQAFGWVKSLTAVGNTLLATMDIIPAFAEQVESGAFKKRSVEIYSEHPGVGKDGGMYLKAISFLGAAIPMVKGMKDIKFAEDLGEAVDIDFSDKETVTERLVTIMAERDTTSAQKEVEEAVAGLQGEHGEQFVEAAETLIEYFQNEPPTKLENGEHFPASAYAYAPDKAKVSTWKLRLCETLTANITKRQLGRAAAALSPGGFSGRRVQISSNALPRV